MCKIPCLLGLVKGNTLGSLGAGGGGGGGPAANDGGSPSFLNGPPVALAPPSLPLLEKEASSLV